MTGHEPEPGRPDGGHGDGPAGHSVDGPAVIRAAAQQRTAVGSPGGLGAMERRNWAEQVERVRAERDRWRQRAEQAEQRLREMEGGDDGG